YNIMLGFHTYKDPLLNENDPYTCYSKRFLELVVVPSLIKETKELELHFPFNLPINREYLGSESEPEYEFRVPFPSSWEYLDLSAFESAGLESSSPLSFTSNIYTLDDDDIY